MLAILDYWKPLAIAAIVICSAAYRAALIHQRDAARIRLANANAEVLELRASNQALSSEIAAQNAAIAGLKANAARDAEIANSRQQAALQAAENAMVSGSARAARLARSPIGPGCDAAIKWGNAQAMELGRW